MLQRSMINRNISDLDAVFVTHEHHDHICGVGVISRRCNIPVFANEGTYRGAEKRLKKLPSRKEFDTGSTLEFQDLHIRSFNVSHDTIDPVGFVVSNGRLSLGYCTDTGIISNLISRRLHHVDSLILEFNHDPDLLKNGPYPPVLQQRVRSNQGHLANKDSAQLLESIYHHQLQHVVLAHISETNNLPEIAYNAAATAIPPAKASTILKIAPQDSPTSLINID